MEMSPEREGYGLRSVPRRRDNRTLDRDGFYSGLQRGPRTTDLDRHVGASTGSRLQDALRQALSGLERLVHTYGARQIPPLLQRVHGQDPARAGEPEQLSHQ